MKTRASIWTLGRGGKWLAGLLTAACLPAAAGDGPDTTPVGPKPEAEIRLFVPAVARVPGSPLPIVIEVSGKTSAVAEYACVALRGEPGSVELAFPGPCSADSDGEDEMASAVGGSAPMDESRQTCAHLTPPKEAAETRSGSVLAVYHPHAAEESVVLFGALYEGSVCEGPTLAETTLVVRMVTETPGTGGAPEPVAGAGGAPEPVAGAGGVSGSGGSGGAGAGGQPVGGGGGEPPLGGMPAQGGSE